MAEKEEPVQYVRNITLEEKLDKLIGLITLQNKISENIFQALNGVHTLLIEKYKSQEMLLEQFPAVMGPPPAAQPTPPRRDTSPTTSPTVGGAHQPQPFNDYSDRTPYGVELEEEARPTAQSFPVPPDARPPEPPAHSAQQIYRAATVGREQVVGESEESDVSVQPPTTKAEMLEQRDTSHGGDV